MVFSLHITNKIIHKYRDIFLSVPERWKVDRKYIDPVNRQAHSEFGRGIRWRSQALRVGAA